MIRGSLLLSAPWDARAFHSVSYPWSDYVPFQAFLGWDPLLAAFAEQAVASGTKVACLAAPEITSVQGLFPFEAAHARRVRTHVHIRFGTFRAPRLLDGAINASYLSEELTAPAQIGAHPFAMGNVLPKSVAFALIGARHGLAPIYLDGTTPPLFEVCPPDEFPVTDRPGDIRASVPAQADGHLVIESFEDFLPQHWMRHSLADPKAASLSSATTGHALPDGCCVLVPWNLAHPGSIVPDLLDKVHFLSLQGRCPVTLLVAPYNDAATGLPALLDVIVAERKAALNAAIDTEPAILFVRATNADSSRRIVDRSCRAWIDGTDPEWRRTASRLQRMGLAVNFLTDRPTDQQGDHGSERIMADEDVWIRTSIYGHLMWRSKTLSLRSLAKLAEAVSRNEDHPHAEVAFEKRPPFDLMDVVWRAVEAASHG